MWVVTYNSQKITLGVLELYAGMNYRHFYFGNGKISSYPVFTIETQFVQECMEHFPISMIIIFRYRLFWSKIRKSAVKSRTIGKGSYLKPNFSFLTLLGPAMFLHHSQFNIIMYHVWVYWMSQYSETGNVLFFLFNLPLTDWPFNWFQITHGYQNDDTNMWQDLLV